MRRREMVGDNPCRNGLQRRAIRNRAWAHLTPSDHLRLAATLKSAVISLPSPGGCRWRPSRRESHLNTPVTVVGLVLSAR
jgi:hypothetical protein